MDTCIHTQEKKLLFMGGEFGQFDEWDESKSLDWHLLDFEKHQQLKQFVKDLNNVYKNERALWYDDFTNAGFEWINCTDAESSIVSMIRKTDDELETIIAVCNFTPVPRTWHKLGVPLKGSYEEILNSDDLKYGGSGIINTEPIYTSDDSWDHKAYSIEMKVPPLGMSILRFKG